MSIILYVINFTLYNFFLECSAHRKDSAVILREIDTNLIVILHNYSRYNRISKYFFKKH